MVPRTSPRRRALRTAAVSALAALGLLLLAGCGSEDEPVASNALAADVFDGEATTLDGERFDLGDLADRDLVVWFWAPW